MLPALRLNKIARFELGIKKRRQNIRRQITRPDIDPRVLINLTAEKAAAIGSFFANYLSALDVA